MPIPLLVLAGAALFAGAGYAAGKKGEKTAMLASAKAYDIERKLRDHSEYLTSTISSMQKEANSYIEAMRALERDLASKHNVRSSQSVSLDPNQRSMIRELSSACDRLTSWFTMVGENKDFDETIRGRLNIAHKHTAWAAGHGHPTMAVAAITLGGFNSWLDAHEKNREMEMHLEKIEKVIEDRKDAITRHRADYNKSKQTIDRTIDDLLSSGQHAIAYHLNSQRLALVNKAFGS